MDCLQKKRCNVKKQLPFHFQLSWLVSLTKQKPLVMTEFLPL